MKKIVISCLALTAISLSGVANAQSAQIPAKFHGCWEASLYGGEIQVQYEISKNKIESGSGDEGWYDGKVISVKGSGNSYTVKSKGKIGNEPFSKTDSLKLSGKMLIIDKDKFKRCG